MEHTLLMVKTVSCEKSANKTNKLVSKIRSSIIDKLFIEFNNSSSFEVSTHPLLPFFIIFKLLNLNGVNKIFVHQSSIFFPPAV